MIRSMTYSVRVSVACASVAVFLAFESTLSEFAWFDRCYSVDCALFSALAGPLLWLLPPGTAVSLSICIVFRIPLSSTVTVSRLAEMSLNSPVGLGISFDFYSSSRRPLCDSAYEGGLLTKTDSQTRKVGENIELYGRSITCSSATPRSISFRFLPSYALIFSTVLVSVFLSYFPFCDLSSKPPVGSSSLGLE